MANTDDIDRQLIALLRKDARLPVASLAATLGISRATVKARMERLVHSGVIERFTIVLGSETAAAPVRAVTLIEVEGRQADRIAKTLAGFPEIRALHTTNGRWDLVAELETASLSAFDEILRAIRLVDGVVSTETNILLNSKLRAGR